MEIIKFSVIAFMIMMPFMFVSHIQTVSDLHENRMEHFIESAIGQASSDAAYAIKTYSESYYDSGDAYHIDVAHKEVIDVFFDSLSYRDFRYDRSEFPVLAFLEYDGITMYQPELDCFYPKISYAEVGENTVSYVDLGGHGVTVDDETGRVTRKTVDKKEMERVVLSTLEECLNRASYSNGLSSEVFFQVPAVSDSFHRAAVHDLGFVVMYTSSRFHGLGQVEIFGIKLPV